MLLTPGNMAVTGTPGSEKTTLLMNLFIIDKERKE